jgi:prophage regulatory protein
MQEAANKTEEPATTIAPIEGLMRRPEVLRLVGCHYVTLWRLIRAGKFPRPVHITSRAVAWRRADVLGWLANLK